MRRPWNLPDDEFDGRIEVLDRRLERARLHLAVLGMACRHSDDNAEDIDAVCRWVRIEQELLRELTDLGATQWYEVYG